MGGFGPYVSLLVSCVQQVHILDLGVPLFKVDVFRWVWAMIGRCGSLGSDELVEFEDLAVAVEVEDYMKSAQWSMSSLKLVDKSISLNIFATKGFLSSYNTLS